jgi:hypothetical protein
LRDREGVGRGRKMERGRLYKWSWMKRGMVEERSRLRKVHRSSVDNRR